MKTNTACYVLTSEGWKPAPMIEYEPPKWYHKVLLWTVGYPLMAVVKCLEWIARRINHD